MRRLSSWLAILAMVLHALWPLLAQAKPRSATLVPVCTVNGVTHYYDLANGDLPLEKKTATHQDHCAFCSFENGRTAAVLSNAAVPAAQQDAATLAVEPIAGSEHHPLRHSPARPRAPPAAS